MINKYTVGLSVLLLASCTVGPDYNRPQMYHNESIQKSLKLNPAANTEVVKDWYRQFGDPALDSLIALSLKDSPDINVAIMKLRRARDELRINAVQNFPMFDVDGSYHYSKPSKNMGFTIDTDYYQTGLDATWELDIWGGGRRQTESSAALLKAASSSLDNVYITLTAEVAADYISYRTYQQQLLIAERNLKLQQDIYDVVAQKYKYGLESDVALNQAKYAIETTKSLIPELKKGIETYRNALTILTGRLPGTFDAQLDAQSKNLVSRRFNFDLRQLYDLPVSVVRNRPDVQAAEQQLAAQNALVGKAIADLFPNMSLSGFLGFQALKVPGLVGSDSFMYNYSPAVTLPLLHWGQLQNQVEVQKDLTLEAFYTYQNSILNATAEIKNSMVNLSEEYRKNSAAYEAAKAQKKVTRLMLEKYRQGLTEFSDVLTTEQDLLSSQKALADSNGQIYQGVIAFYKAVGGGYKPKSLYQIQKSLDPKGFACNARCGR